MAAIDVAFKAIRCTDLTLLVDEIINYLHNAHVGHGPGAALDVAVDGLPCV